MEYQIVRSTAGRDRGELFLVVGRQGDRFLLADGRRRKRSRPKQKSARHFESVARVQTDPVMGDQISDKEIYRLLAACRRAQNA